MMINGLAALCAGTLTLITAEQASGRGEAPHRSEPERLAADHICTAYDSAQLLWRYHETLQKEKETCSDCAAESSAGSYTR